MSRPVLHHSQKASRVTLLVLCLGFIDVPASYGWSETGVAARPRPNIAIEDLHGTLMEIKERRRVVLLISRSSVLDASGSDDAVVAEALAAESREALNHRYTFRIIASKLNQYIRKYHSLSPVYEIAQADIIIYFKLVEYRRLLNGVYPYGELFVIANPRPEEQRAASVVWKTQKIVFAEDAVKDFIRDLKRVRAER